MAILVVDTDHDWAEMLTGWLQKLGYEAHHEFTGERAKIEWEKLQPDLVILDTNLTDIDALKMCREMRGKHVALVVVTTDDQDPQFSVMCLESGADECLRKPSSPAQLPAYINTSLARRRGPNFIKLPTSIITIGPIRFNLRQGEVSVVGKMTRLTPVESVVLYYLAVNATTVCTDSQISSYVLKVNNDEFTGLLRSYIRHLRQKIEPDFKNPIYILTVPGVGYTLVGHVLDEAVQKTSTDKGVSSRK